MPPSNKRSRDDGGSDEQRISKGTKLGAFSFPSHNVPNETASPDGPDRLLCSSSSGANNTTSSSTSNRSNRAPASKNRNERERIYFEKMAELNFNAAALAKSKLESGDISRDGFYTNFAQRYKDEAAKYARQFKRDHGDVAVCGSGEAGQLGMSESILGSRKFKLNASLRNQNINQIAAGGMHVVALDENGKVYTWGCSDEGSLGLLEPNEDGFLPSVVTGFYPSQYGPNGTEGLLDAAGKLLPFEQRPEANIVQVFAGNTQSLALCSKGNVYSWGSLKDNEGRYFREVPPKDDPRPQISPRDLAKVENGDEELEYLQVPRGKNNYPVHVVQLPKRVTALSTGENCNAALLEDHTIVTWGIDLQGEMSRPVCKLSKKTDNQLIIKEHLTPHPVQWAGPALKRTVLQVSCGGWHLLVASREGNNQLCVYSSGLNNYGQLGHGMCQGESGLVEDNKNREKLTKVEFFEGKGIETVEGGYHGSYFVGGCGKKMYVCGRGDYGQLGIALEQSPIGYFVSTPVRVPLVYDVKTQGNISDPTKNCIVEETIDEDEQPEIEQVAAGSSAHHVIVITKQGDVYSWGFGESGQLGQNRENSSIEEADITLPQKMSLVTKKKVSYKIKYASSGGQHSAVIISTSDSFGQQV
ncbi:RCC1 domain-containing protein [Skeletonema marinoi]|uniref:RCC1 domain-containing protein n=1 Tax=Skeletonema marinoi TaxID=267567 RepID=A0AAD8Y3K9_9STRA|nr:RCC1 domain-containing protein [Skeletonema marinoi]